MPRSLLRPSRLGRAVASLAVVAGLGVLPGATPAATAAGDTAAGDTTAGDTVAAAPAPPASGGVRGPAAGSASPYRLYRNPDGSAVRFDPCRPLRVQINAPSPGAEADAREALRRLAEATGHRVVVQGHTDFVPTRAARTLPGVELVIAWALPGGAPGASDILDEGQLGTGGWTSEGQRYDGRVVWRATAGFAVLDATRDLEPGFGPGLTRGALLLHEVAHALGVDHVDDDTQVMSPVLQHRRDPVALGAGDLEALRRVGVQAGCLPG
jgi:hypothetical protein